jgi:energy-coupling factor transporter ATP-binding protein EcfA2
LRYVNDPYPWTEGVSGDLSIVDLIANGTIPPGPAAVLWWALERGASLLTAGGPSGAGKSTLANACLGFLPDGARAYAVAGRDDPLRLPTGGGPIYLLVSELSDHPRPFYVAGAAARRIFAKVREGARVVGTLHADSVDEAIEVLGGEVELLPEDIARADLIAITRVVDEPGAGDRRRMWRIPSDRPVRRRVVEIGLLGPDAGRGVGWTPLATWNAASERLEPADAPAVLARWDHVAPGAAQTEIVERADALASLAAEGRRDPRDLAAAVRRLRAS